MRPGWRTPDLRSRSQCTWLGWPTGTPPTSTVRGSWTPAASTAGRAASWCRTCSARPASSRSCRASRVTPRASTGPGWPQPPAPPRRSAARPAPPGPTACSRWSSTVRCRPRAHLRGLVRRHQLPGRTARREPHGRLPRLHPPAHRRDRRPGRPRPRAARPTGTTWPTRSSGPSATAPGCGSHRDDLRAAPYATDVIEGTDAATVAPGITVIPVPGHTRGSVVYLVDDRWLFTGDSLAWSYRREDLVAFRGACWYSWSELTTSLGRLAELATFEWVLPGHGPRVHLDPADATRRLEVPRREDAGRRLKRRVSRRRWPLRPWSCRRRSRASSSGAGRRPARPGAPCRLPAARRTSSRRPSPRRRTPRRTSRP